METDKGLTANEPQDASGGLWEAVAIVTRCGECEYFRPYTLKDGGYCIHPDLHVDFHVTAVEVDLREGYGEDAEAFADVMDTDFCSKGERRED